MCPPIYWSTVHSLTDGSQLLLPPVLQQHRVILLGVAS